MAKGNLFQGMGRGALGDMVLHHVDGEQVSRVRVRHPHNPRSDEQQYQRAIMATVLRAYEFGKVIFSHSFQGNGVTANDQSLFMQRNCKLLRQAIKNDLDQQLRPNLQASRVVAPETVAPVPFAYQISEGTYPQKLFTFGESRDDWDLMVPTPLEDETVAHYCNRLGIIPGDYYTLCCFGQSDSDFAYGSDESREGCAQYKCTFNWARLAVRDGVQELEQPLQVWGDIFYMENEQGRYELQGKELNSNFCEGWDILNLSPQYYYLGSIGVIRSRRNSDLRSTSFMKYFRGTSPTGVYPTSILEVWGRGGEVYPE